MVGGGGVDEGFPLVGVRVNGTSYEALLSINQTHLYRC